MGPMPCDSRARMWAGTSRRARMPPWTLGWSVLTRPSSISGKPVTSETSSTGTPESRRSLAVPPVDRICTPRPARPRAKSTTPALSCTLSSARFTLLIGSPRSGRCGPHAARSVVRASLCSSALPDLDDAALDVEPALREEPDGFRIDAMLLYEDALSETLFGVAGEHGHRGLQHDGTRVHSLVHEVDGRSCHAHAVSEGLALGVETREGGEERGVDVESAPAEVGDVGGGEDPHVSRVTDEIDPSLLQGAHDGLLVRFPARILLGVEEERLDAVIARDVESGRRLAVGDQHDHGRGDPPRVRRFHEGAEVRAAAGGEDANAERFRHRRRTARRRGSRPLRTRAHLMPGAPAGPGRPRPRVPRAESRYPC